jgi:hypothetical protein
MIPAFDSVKYQGVNSMTLKSHDTGKALNLPDESTTIAARHSKRGDEMKVSDIQGANGVTLGALRQLVQGGGRSRSMASITVKTIGGGFGIHYTVPFGQSGWLLSEHTMQIRGFARAEAAFNVCRQLGLKTVHVELYDAAAVAPGHQQAVA